MLACTLLVAGCKPDEGKNGGMAKFSASRDVLFSADINRFAVKATDTAFDNGDEIGLFAGAPIVKNNVKGVVAGTKVTVDAANPIQWLTDQTAPWTSSATILTMPPSPMLRRMISPWPSTRARMVPMPLRI